MTHTAGAFTLRMTGPVSRVGQWGVRGTRGWPVFFFQAEDGIRDVAVTGVQTCALPISKERTMQTERAELYFQRGSSDKVYHVQFENAQDHWSVQAQWGRRGSALQSDVKVSGDRKSVV